MISEAGKRFALVAGAASLALAALGVGGGAGLGTTTAAPAPPTTSEQPGPESPPTEPTKIEEEPHDLGGGAGGGMG